MRMDSLTLSVADTTDRPMRANILDQVAECSKHRITALLWQSNPCVAVMQEAMNIKKFLDISFIWIGIFIVAMEGMPLRQCLYGATFIIVQSRIISDLGLPVC